MQFTTGIIKEPHFVVIYGPDGVGKTTFAAQAPKPIIVGPESGSNRIKTTRARNIATMADVRNAVKWLRNEKHDFKTLALDSLDWIEPLLWAEVCQEQGGVSNIEEVGGGFQKGYTIALQNWSRFIAELKDLRANREMNVIAIAHAQIRTVKDPRHALEYDKFTLKLQDSKSASASALWREAVDAVLFANFEDTIFKANAKDKTNKGKAVDEAGPRKLYTVRHPTYDAKNRLGLPEELPLDYQAFAEAAEAGEPDSVDAVKKDLAELSMQLEAKDKASFEKMSAAIKAAENDAARLINIRNYARVLVGAA